MRAGLDPTRIVAMLPEDPDVNRAGLMGEEVPAGLSGFDELLEFVLGRMDGRTSVPAPPGPRLPAQQTKC